MASLATSGGGAHGDSSFDKWIHSDTAGAEGRALHSPKRDHVPPHVSPMMLAHSPRNHANGRAQGTNEGSVSSTHCVSPLLLQTTRHTKLLPVVQLRSGVILLMGDPEPNSHSLRHLHRFAFKLKWIQCKSAIILRHPARTLIRGG